MSTPRDPSCRPPSSSKLRPAPPLPPPPSNAICASVISARPLSRREGLQDRVNRHMSCAAARMRETKPPSGCLAGDNASGGTQLFDTAVQQRGRDDRSSERDRFESIRAETEALA